MDLFHYRRAYVPPDATIFRRLSVAAATTKKKNDANPNPNPIIVRSRPRSGAYMRREYPDKP